MEGCNINLKDRMEDRMGNTPLAWAACNGYKEVARLLLRRDDIEPNKPDERKYHSGRQLSMGMREW